MVYMYWDESGHIRFPIEERDLFIGTLLRMRRASTKKEVEKVVRRTRKKFEGFLKATDRLNSDERLGYLGGSSAKVQEGSKRRRELGLGSYPDRCREFINKLSDINGVQLYVIAWPQYPKFEAKKGNKKDTLVGAKYYANIMGDLVVHPLFPELPMLPNPDREYEISYGEGGEKKVRRIAVIVMHQYSTGTKTDKMARVYIKRKILKSFLVSDKLNGFSLNIYSNPAESDDCLQAVDVMVNFFYQTIHFGIEIEIETPGKAISKRMSEGGRGDSRWPKDKWKDAFNLIKPKVKSWHTLTYPIKPEKYAKKNY